MALTTFCLFITTLENIHSRSATYLVTPHIHTLRPRQDGRHFADDSFKRIFLNENLSISITISQKFYPNGPNNNIPALVQIMAWRRPGDKPLSESMMVSFPTYLCVTWPQWVNSFMSCIMIHLDNFRLLKLLRSFVPKLTDLGQRAEIKSKIGRQEYHVQLERIWRMHSDNTSCTFQ